MATVIGDRDVLLLGSSQRALNPLNSGIILQTSAPAFKVDTSGNPLPTTITIKANLIGISGTVAFTASGATVTDNHDNTATLAFSSLTGTSCTVTAAITVNSQAFSSSVTLAKVTDGAVGGTGANGNQYATVYLYQWNSATPSAPSGTSGYTWATGVNSTYSGSDGWSVSVPTNPGTPGLKLYVAITQITAAGGTASTVVSYGSATIQAWTQNGANGVSAVTGILTNEATTLAATSAGVVSDFSPAGGTFKVFSGSTDVTGASVTYSVVSQSGCTVSIAATGVYSVSAMSVNQANATLQAVYGGVTIQKIISLAKSVAGATGTAAYVVVSSTGQVFSRANSAGAFAPTSQTLTATPYGGTATYQWQYWTGSAWTNVASSGTSSTYTVNSGDFTDTRTYRVQATISGTVYTDQITLMQVTGGTNGTNAIQSAVAQVYQWAATIPAAPTGSPTYTWSNGNISAIPSGWSATPGTAPSQGMTLWTARVFITDSATNAATVFNWTSSAIVAVGYSGSNGSAGIAGASYVTAYCASSTGSATSAPAATTGKTSLPATNSGGITGTWSSTVPTLTSGQYLYQSDGIYDPTTNQVTWSIPYWSSLKVGNLSAITANLGAINAGSIDLGSAGNSWHVDSNGNMWSGATLMSNAPFYVDNAGNVVMKSVLIKAADGSTVLSSGLSLAQQVPTNPNRVPRISSWPTFSGCSSGFSTSDSRFVNGEYIYIPNNSGTLMAATSAIGIPQGAYYTVSFDAYCTGAARTLVVDLYNGTVDTTGITQTLTNTSTRYSFTESISDASSPSAYLRVFCTATGSDVVVSNIKVEYGVKATPWCDNMITPANASTFIANGAIQHAHIGSAAIDLANINTASIGNLSAISATIGTLRTASSGARIEISDNLIVGYRSNNTMSFKISS